MGKRKHVHKHARQTTPPGGNTPERRVRSKHVRRDLHSATRSARAQHAVNSAHVINAHPAPHATKLLYHRGAHSSFPFSASPLFTFPLTTSTKRFQRANTPTISHVADAVLEKHKNKPGRRAHYRQHQPGPTKPPNAGHSLGGCAPPLAERQHRGQHPRNHQNPPRPDNRNTNHRTNPSYQPHHALGRPVPCRFRGGEQAHPQTGRNLHHSPVRSRETFAVCLCFPSPPTWRANRTIIPCVTVIYIQRPAAQCRKASRANRPG